MVKKWQDPASNPDLLTLSSLQISETLNMVKMHLILLYE